MVETYRFCVFLKYLEILEIVNVLYIFLFFLRLSLLEDDFLSMNYLYRYAFIEKVVIHFPFPHNYTLVTDNDIIYSIYYIYIFENNTRHSKLQKTFLTIKVHYTKSKTYFFNTSQ